MSLVDSRNVGPESTRLSNPDFLQLLKQEYDAHVAACPNDSRRPGIIALEIDHRVSGELLGLPMYTPVVVGNLALKNA